MTRQGCEAASLLDDAAGRVRSRMVIVNDELLKRILT
jgi:hypothetical protein